MLIDPNKALKWIFLIWNCGDNQHRSHLIKLTISTMLVLQFGLNRFIFQPKFTIPNVYFNPNARKIFLK